MVSYVPNDCSFLSCQKEEFWNTPITPFTAEKYYPLMIIPLYWYRKTLNGLFFCWYILSRWETFSVRLSYDFGWVKRVTQRLYLILPRKVMTLVSVETIVQLKMSILMLSIFKIHLVNGDFGAVLSGYGKKSRIYWCTMQWIPATHRSWWEYGTGWRFLFIFWKCWLWWSKMQRKNSKGRTHPVGSKSTNGFMIWAAMSWMVQRLVFGIWKYKNRSPPHGYRNLEWTWSLVWQLKSRIWSYFEVGTFGYQYSVFELHGLTFNEHL